MRFNRTSAGILSCTLLVVLGSNALAAEPAQECVPFLLKIPYVNRLFAPSAQALRCEENSAAATATFVPHQFRIIGSDGLECIGIDFDCQVVGAAGPCCEAVCPASPCPQCTAHCGDACEVECLTEVTASESRQLMDLEAFHIREIELLDEVFEARLEAAVAQAQLKARDEASAKEAKLQKQLLDAKLENARLQASLEFAEEKQKLAAELHQAQLELVALKGKGGSATAKLARPSSKGAR